MSSVYDNIRAALETELSGLPGSPAISWENVDYNPTTGQPYLRTTLVPTLRRPSTLGDRFQFYYQGYLEVMVYTPKNQGPGPADTLADGVMERFDPPKTVTNGLVNVQIRTTEREQGDSLPDAPFYYVPVVIRWFCYNE